MNVKLSVTAAWSRLLCSIATAHRASTSLLLGLVVAVAASPVLAHTASTAYLDATAAQSPSLNMRIALRDVDAMLDLDANGDGQLTWGEVEDRRADIDAWLRSSVALRRGDHRCALSASPPQFTRIDGSGHLLLKLQADCAARGALHLDYRLFDGVDPSHRVLVSLPGQPGPRLLAPGATLALDAQAAPGAGFAELFVDGVRHIVGGIDHLLFLIALLLPAVLERRDGRWVARSKAGAALKSVLWIVTAFTLAHSLTLAAASLGWLRISATIIEPLIAATVLAAALNNLWPVITRRLAWVAFGFGLVHGFGFAEVLLPLALAPLDMAQALLAFNLGVEAGQLAVVALAFALLATLRHWPAYPRWVLGGSSCALVLIASGWIIERVFDVPVFVFG